MGDLFLSAYLFFAAADGQLSAPQTGDTVITALSLTALAAMIFLLILFFRRRK